MTLVLVSLYIELGKVYSLTGGGIHTMNLICENIIFFNKKYFKNIQWYHKAFSLLSSCDSNNVLLFNFKS